MDGSSGTLRVSGLKLAVGALERKLHDLGGGKVSVQIVGQRVTPNRFEAVSIAARVVPSPFHVIILVDKQPLGLKGLIAGMVERKIRNELGEKVPVEIIFARAHSKDYQAIKRALLTEEAEKYTREETEKPETPAFDAKRLAGEVAGEEHQRCKTPPRPAEFLATSKPRRQRNLLLVTKYRPSRRLGSCNNR